MKTEFLNGFLGKTVDEEMLKQIQAESGKDVTAAKTSLQSQIDTLTEQVNQRDTDLGNLKTQLAEAGQSAGKLSEVQKSFDALQEKYTKETTEYKDKLEAQKYEFSVREAMSGIKFSCNAAKKEFLNGLMNEKLPIKDGALLGFDTYLEKVKKEDPDSFAKEDPEDGKDGNKKPPYFVPPADPNKKTPPETDFGFNFLGVRSRETK